MNRRDKNLTDSNFLYIDIDVIFYRLSVVISFQIVQKDKTMYVSVWLSCGRLLKLAVNETFIGASLIAYISEKFPFDHCMSGWKKGLIRY